MVYRSKNLFSLFQKALFFLYSFVFSTAVLAQVNNHPQSDNILMALNQLPIKTSVLYIAAHPDDENNRLLTYLVKGRHFRTGYLALTRGEGGQNLIGREQGEPLGLIRTEELLAAREVDGAEQFFSRALDFGYSKNPEETLLFWNRDSILSDMVWVIRNFQPDIIIVRFPATGEGGHGNHTASAILTPEAIKLAADSKAYSEQLKYCPVWQVKKVLWNTFNFGGLNTTAKDQLHFQVNDYNPLLGMTYGDLAAKSRSNHKSQGFGTGSAKGEQYEYFKTLMGSPSKSNILEGMDSTWESLPKADSAFNDILKAAKQFQPEKPEEIIPLLVHAYGQINLLPKSRLRTTKLKDISHLLLACSGVQVECISSRGTLSYDSTLPLGIDILKRRNTPVTIKKYSLADGPVTLFGKEEGVGLNFLKVFHVGGEIDLDSSYSTQPYSLEKPHSMGRYEVNNLEWIGLPKKPNKLYVKIFFQIMGQDFFSTFPILSKFIDPVKGEYFEPVSIVPPVSTETNSRVYIFNRLVPKKIKVLVTSLKDSISTSIQLTVPKGWVSSPKTQAINIASQFGTQTVNFMISPLSSTMEKGKVDSGLVTAKLGNRLYKEEFHRIAYDHIPWIDYTEPTKFKLVSLSLNIPPRKIGYIMGAGDYIPEILEEIGYSVHILTDAEINPANLSQYNTLILGIRAFNTRSVLKFAHQVLMNYVQQGGTLLVQYNTNSNLVTSQLGPFPISIDRDRVTDETAKIDIQYPNAPLLNYPNIINESDFEGWIQERGLYFPNQNSINNHYKTLIGMHDPGERSLNTGIIYTDYGKGMFIYTSLVFFRELPYGNPGAIRLFVNLINGRHE